MPVSLISSRQSVSPSNAGNTLAPKPFSSPSPLVALACGSRSIRRIFFRFSAKQAEKLMAVVVLPTPPFWFAKATTFVSIVFASICVYPQFKIE